MRCFIGIPAPPAWQAGLAKLAATWKPRFSSKITWTRPELWHLTLQFLGEVPPGLLPAVVSALESIQLDAFSMSILTGGAFPDMRKPRVVWAGIHSGAESCGQAAALVGEAYAPLGYPPDPRPFTPHLTCFRVKGPVRRDDPWAEFIEAVRDAPWPEARVERLVLWESKLSAPGPRYVEWGAVTLRA